MATYSQRQLEILTLVREQGAIGIEALSRDFAVSTQTIRRDVNQLCEIGELRRVRGGVTLPPANISSKLHGVSANEKHANLATKVATHIPDYSSLSIASGPMMVSVMQALENKTGLKIFTNDLAVALVASQQKDWQVIIAGGIVASSADDEKVDPAKPVSGSKVAEFFGRFEADFGLLQATAISSHGTLLEVGEEEAEIAQTILTHSADNFLLIDQKQFDETAHVRAGHLDQVNQIFDDQSIPLKSVDTKGTANALLSSTSDKQSVRWMGRDSQA